MVEVDENLKRYLCIKSKVETRLKGRYCMKLVRFVLPNSNNNGKRFGFCEEKFVYDITSLFPNDVDFFTYLLKKA